MKYLVQSIVTGTLAAAAMTLSPAIAAESDKTETKAKKPKKITDRRHPDYVRCRSEPIIGSLARRKRVCMTNAEWVEYTRTGSRDAKQFVEDMQTGQNTSN